MTSTTKTQDLEPVEAVAVEEYEERRGGGLQSAMARRQGAIEIPGGACVDWILSSDKDGAPAKVVEWK